jgi:hypothetical protein
VAANPQHGLFDTTYKAYLYSTQCGTCLLFQGQEIQVNPRVEILADAPIVLQDGNRGFEASFRVLLPPTEIGIPAKIQEQKASAATERVRTLFNFPSPAASF